MTDEYCIWCLEDAQYEEKKDSFCTKGPDKKSDYEVAIGYCQDHKYCLSPDFYHQMMTPEYREFLSNNRIPLALYEDYVNFAKQAKKDKKSSIIGVDFFVKDAYLSM